MNVFPPMISPRFQVAGGILQYKPYPSYPSWLDAWDVGALVPADVQAQIDAINLSIAALEANDAALSSTISGVAIIATDASDAAAAAQADATTALANAATAQSTANTSIANDAALDTRIDALESFAGGTFFPDSAYIVPGQFSGGRWGTPTLQAGQWNNAYWTISGSGTIEEIKIPLSAGNYNISIGYVKSANSGRMAIKLDGTLFGSTRLDFYNATTILGQYVDVALKTGVTAGVHTLRLEMDGRNVSSSGFAWLVSFISIRQA